MKNEFLEGIWRVREKLAARFDYDLHRMVVHLQKQQAKHGARLVRAPSLAAERISLNPRGFLLPAGAAQPGKWAGRKKGTVGGW